ncbi:uncharacterized protein DS421_13g421780 [Arachis hypogaea]|nr:uncharacterized protein DS421_13g421780 [Arachis hypogaea]
MHKKIKEFYSIGFIGCSIVVVQVVKECLLLNFAQYLLSDGHQSIKFSKDLSVNSLNINIKINLSLILLQISIALPYDLYHLFQISLCSVMQCRRLT